MKSQVSLNGRDAARGSRSRLVAQNTEGGGEVVKVAQRLLLVEGTIQPPMEQISGGSNTIRAERRRLEICHRTGFKIFTYNKYFSVRNSWEDCSGRYTQ